MMTNVPSLDLVEFIETKILPKYTEFDRAHNLEHVTRVIRRSLDLVKTTGADINMAYTIAAYHDLGMSGPRAIHHITGGKILAADSRLKKWFTPEQIKIMKEAVEDHRASASRSPRSLYGKIIAEADRDIVPEVVFQRTVQFGIGIGADWQVCKCLGVSADLNWGLTGVFPGDFKTVEQTLYPVYGTIGVFYRLK